MAYIKSPHMWEVKILDASGKILEALLTVQWKSYKNHINSRSLMGIPSYQLQKFEKKKDFFSSLLER